MTRQAPNVRTAVLPSMIGMGLPVPLLSLVGLAGVLGLQTSDRTQGPTRLGGSVVSAVALLFVIAANLGASTAGIYASAVGLTAVPGLRRLPWNVVLLLSLTPVFAVGVFTPDWFFAHFGTFLAYLGVFFAPVVGIQIVDYFVLRRQRICLRAIYDRGPRAPYAYWLGLNPTALTAMAAGVGTYLRLLDPESYTVHEPFSWVGASLPTAGVAALVHVVLTRLVVRPAGRGGYDEGARARPAREGPRPAEPAAAPEP